MNCLHCGDCCKRMSPVSAPEPCPFIIEDGDFVFCDIYENRHLDCVNHSFPHRVCPIGSEKLGLATPDEVAARIDAGYLKTKNR